MKDYLLALDQGTTSSRAILFAPDGGGGLHGPDPLPPALSPARLGGARPPGAAGQPAPGGGPVRGGQRGGPRGHRRPGPGQPAGDRPALGAAHRPAGGPRHRLAVPPDGGPVHPAAGGGVHPGHPGPDGAAPRRLLLRHQVPLAAGPRPGRPAAGGGRGAALRHRGQLAAVEPHRGQGPRLGFFQLLPHHAL